MYIISKIGKLVSNMLQTTHRDVKKINRDNESYYFLPRGPPQVQSATKMTNQ